MSGVQLVTSDDVDRVVDGESEGNGTMSVSTMANSAVLDQDSNETLRPSLSLSVPTQVDSSSSERSTLEGTSSSGRYKTRGGPFDMSLREWGPLSNLLNKIPSKAQKGLTTLDLVLTCVTAVGEFLALGTNVGLVYWFNRRTERLDRLKTESTASPICSLSVISTVDYMLAAGNTEGLVTIFQIPKAPGPPYLNGSQRKAAEIHRFDVFGLHSCKIAALEWSTNGMKLFSGDAAGSVVLTELNFDTGQVEARLLLQEKLEIVQLSYSKKYLLVCSTFQSIVYSLENNSACKVGTQDRKVQGRFGGTFRKSSYSNKENGGLKLYSVRPGGRIWLADTSGIVEHTIKFKDLLLDNSFANIPVINPNPSSSPTSAYKDFQIGSLYNFVASCVVTFHKNVMYVLDPVDTKLVGVCYELRGILDICVNLEGEEIFVLESGRRLLRLSTSPDVFSNSTANANSNGGFNPSSHLLRNIPSLDIPKFMSNVTDLEQPLSFLTSKIKETSRFVLQNPKKRINLNTGTIMNTLKQVIEADYGGDIQDGQAFHGQPEVALEGGEEHNFSDDMPGSAAQDRFEHISRLPFDDDFLAPVPKPKPVKKKRRKPKSKSSLKVDGVPRFQSSGDAVSLCSSTLSVNSLTEEDLVVARRLSAQVENPSQLPLSSGFSMSQSWAAGETSAANDDLESKEEILARKLNWPELLPESRRSTLGLDLDLDDMNSTRPIFNRPYPSPASLPVPIPLEEVVGEEPEEEPVVPSSDLVLPSPTKSEIFEDSIDIYTKYAPRSGDDQDDSSIPSALSFGPPSSGTSNGCVGFLQPSVLEIDEKSLSTSPDSLTETDLVPIRDMIVEPVVQHGNEKWVTYTAPAALQSISACERYMVCTDKKNHVYVSEFDERYSSLRWVEAKYHASQTAISSCGKVFWRVHKGTLYSLMTPDPQGTLVEGSEWSKLLTGVGSMAIQSAHVGWVVKQDGSIYVASGLLATAVVPDFERVPCPFSVSRVATDEFKNVWVISQDGKLFYRIGITDNKPQGMEWKEKYFEEKLPALVAAVGLGPSATLWVGDVGGNLYFVERIGEPGREEGRAFHWRISLVNDFSLDGRLATVASGSSSTSSSLKTRLSETLKTERITSLLAGSKHGVPLIAGSSSSIWFSVTGSTIIHVNRSAVEGHRWVPSTVTRPMRVSLWSAVMAGSIYKEHGYLWLLDPKERLFYVKPDGGEAKTMDLPCSSAISCVIPAPEALWVLNKEGILFARGNISSHNPVGHGWSEVDLSSLGSDIRLTHASCGSDVAWACDSLGRVFMRVGSLQPPSPKDISPAWMEVEGDEGCHAPVFRKVYVGSSGGMVWALDDRDNIYVREAVYPDFPIGTRWLLVSGIEAVALTLSETAVWALSPKGEIFRRFGISGVNFVGDFWKRIPGPNDYSVQTFSASLCDEVWALDSSGLLMKHSQRSLSFREGVNKPRPSTSKSKVVLDPEDKDWELIESFE